MVRFERVIDGILRYLDREIYPTMSELQAIMARIAVARLVGNKDAFKVFLQTNPIMQTFAVIDGDGCVDIDRLASELKEQIAAVGKLRIDTKILGAYTFHPEDVDKLLATIKGG